MNAEYVWKEGQWGIHLVWLLDVWLGRRLSMRPCSYRQAVVAGRQSFLWDHRASPSLCFKPILGAHLPVFGGRGPRKHTILPLSSQAWTSPSTIPTQPHCKQGCRSTARRVFTGNQHCLAGQSLLSSMISHRFYVEGCFCTFMSAPCVWHLNQYNL